MAKREGDAAGSTSARAVLVGSFLVFALIIAVGIAFVGGDAGTPEGTDITGDGGSDDGAPDESSGDTNATREVAVATLSPDDQPYEYKLNASKKPDVSDLNTSRVEMLVVEEANEERTNRSVDAVTHAPRLSEPARNHSENMSDSFYLGHVEPDGTGVEERYLDECAALRGGREEFRYSENVATVWYKSVFEPSGANASVLLVTEEGVAEALVSEWMNSPTHRRNLLGEDWETTGVGVVVDENGTVFGTQAFCTAG